MKKQFIGLHLDFIGFSASMLCAAHCAIMPFLLSLAPLAGLQFLDNQWIEIAIIILSFIIASYALVYGYRRHHHRPLALIIVAVGFILIGTGHISHGAWKEVLLTCCGALTISMAHVVNWKFIKQSRVELLNCSYHEKS